MLYYIILCYIILCYIILYYVILYYIMLCYIILCYIILYIINEELVSTLPTLASLPTGHILWDMTYFHLLYFIIICHHNFNILHKSSPYFPDVSWYSSISCPRSTHFTWIHPRSGSAGLLLALVGHPGPISGSFIRNFFRAPKAAPGMMACLDRYSRWKMSLRTVKDNSNMCFEHGKSL